MSLDNNPKLNDFIKRISDNKILRYVVVAVLSIIIVLIVSFSGGKNNSSVSEGQNNVVYDLECRLEDALSQVDGAGKVKVVITVESGMETVLAMKTVTVQTDKGIEKTETPILVNGKTVVLKEKFPEIAGVLIVLGTKNISVISKIQQATTSLLNIKSSQVEILTKN